MTSFETCSGSLFFFFFFLHMLTLGGRDSKDMVGGVCVCVWYLSFQVVFVFMLWLWVWLGVIRIRRPEKRHTIRTRLQTPDS